MKELTIVEWEFYASVISGWSSRASLMVREKLVDGSSVSEIANRHGVSTQCVYSSVKRYRSLIRAVNNGDYIEIKVVLTAEQAKVATGWSNENKSKANKFMKNNVS